MAKKGEKGHYARKRDAIAAATKKGLKEDEYEIVDGPKGFTYREKRKHTPVPGAKMHVGKEPDATLEPIHEEVAGHPNIWKEKSTGRYRYSDETEDYSQESFETIEKAEEMLTLYVKNELQGPPPKADPPAEPAFPTPILPHGSLDAAKAIGEAQKAKEDVANAAVVAGVWSPDLEKSVNDAEVIGSAECPKCKSKVPIVEIDEVKRFTDHGDPNTDEDCDHAFEKFEGEVIPLKKPGDPIPNAQLKSHEVASVKVQDGTIDRKHKSTIENPSKAVWHIAEELIAKNPQISRKEVVAECQRRGIAFYTARTQYQQWLTVRRESAANAAEANKKKE